MKTTQKILVAAASFATIATFSATASATVYNIDYHDAGVWQRYDSDNQAYAMKFRADQGKDGFWLVVTGGENPKGDGVSNAILYGDTVNNRITAYTYDGTNSADSYENGTFLGSYDNVFSSGGEHPTRGYDLTMFSLDVSGINNALGAGFDGIQFGDEAGIWFHQSAGSDFTYGSDGSITDYAFDTQMWLDRGNDAARIVGSVECVDGVGSLGYLNSCASTQLAGGSVGVTSSSGGGGGGGGSVPAPGGLALILAGLIGLRQKIRYTKN